MHLWFADLSFRGRVSVRIPLEHVRAFILTEDTGNPDNHAANSDRSVVGNQVALPGDDGGYCGDGLSLKV